MTTSGTFGFNLSVAEVLDEAFEQCLVDPSSLGTRHIKSAMRSLNLLFADWENRGVKLWAVDEQTLTLTEGTGEFTPPTGTQLILNAVLRRDGADVPIYEISRQEYLDIPKKDTKGRPDRFYHERTLSPVVRLWPVPENSTDQMIYFRLRELEDFAAMADNPDAPKRWLTALCSGLAALLAAKFAVELEAKLIAKADAAFKAAKIEDRERGDTTISVSYRRGAGRR